MGNYSMLTRAQFDNACKVFIDKYQSHDHLEHVGAMGLTHWSWNEHPVRYTDMAS